MDLKVQSRKILGKEVKTLRQQGIVPLHLFGHGIPSLALQVNAGEFQKAMSKVGTTSLLGILVDEATTPRNVVIREVQRHPMTGKLVHIDLYEVSMAEKIKMDVSIRLVGEIPALKSSDNQLFQELETLEIESLPAQIPPYISIDVSSLTEPGKEIFVRDIKPIAGVEILTNPEQLIVKIAQRAAVKVEEEPVAAAPEVAAPAEESETKKE